MTTLVHDWAGHRTRIQRDNRVWKYAYTLNGNLWSETTPLPGPTSDPLRYTTSYAYDDLDRVTSKLVPTRTLTQADQQLLGIGMVSYQYDATGDALNRVGRIYQARVYFPTTGTYAQNNVLTTTYDYDAEGNVKQDRRTYHVGDMSGTGSVTAARRIKTTYWPGGKIRELDTGDGTTTDGAATVGRVSYDDRNLPSALTYKLAGTNPATWPTAATVSRNLAGMITSRGRQPDGFTEVAQTSTWTYDKLGRITRQQVVAGATSVADQQLTYWGTDDPKTLLHSGSGISTRNFNYTYDARHQLLNAATTGTPSFSSSYTFTAGGRFSTANVAAGASAGSDIVSRSATYVYSTTDKERVIGLQLPTGSLATYTYDEAGNIITRTQGSLTSFVWDGDDQLRRATSGSASEDYYYDHDGNRFAVVKRTNNAVAQVKYFQGPLEVWHASNGAVSATYATLSLGTPIARVESRATVELQYTSTLQSLLATTSLGGAVNIAFAYGPYGEVLQQGGTQATTHRYRFNDKHKDDLTGNLYYGVRYYDPVLLGWTSADPAYRFTPDAAWDEPRRANLYGFDQGNPLRYVDPDGRSPAPLSRLNPVKAIKGFANDIKNEFKGLFESGEVLIADAVVGTVGGLFGDNPLNCGEGVSCNSKSTKEEVIDTALAAVGVALLFTPAGATEGALGRDGLAAAEQSETVGAAGATERAGTAAKDVTRRPSGFRKGTVQGAWDDAASGSQAGSKACPTCKTDVHVAPGEGPRDWDVDHQPKWKDRDLRGKSRKEVLDEYNRNVRLRCKSCNRRDNR